MESAPNGELGRQSAGSSSAQSGAEGVGLRSERSIIDKVLTVHSRFAKSKIGVC